MTNDRVAGMTYRERRERRAERLREWAEKRERKAEAAQKRVHDIADNIPFGQPILVGHHSERHARRDQDRMHRGMEATIEHGRKADSFRGKAAHIESATEHAIYDDDPDAAERLRKRIAELETKQAKMKTRNTEARKTKTEKPYDGWELKNNNANIRRLKKRLDGLGKPVLPRYIQVRYDGECATCGTSIKRGECALYWRAERALYCNNNECYAGREGNTGT